MACCGFLVSCTVCITRGALLVLSFVSSPSCLVSVWELGALAHGKQDVDWGTC